VLWDLEFFCYLFLLLSTVVMKICDYNFWSLLILTELFLLISQWIWIQTAILLLMEIVKMNSLSIHTLVWYLYQRTLVIISLLICILFWIILIIKLHTTISLKQFLLLTRHTFINLWSSKRSHWSSLNEMKLWIIAEAMWKILIYFIKTLRMIQIILFHNLTWKKLRFFCQISLSYDIIALLLSITTDLVIWRLCSMKTLSNTLQVITRLS